MEKSCGIIPIKPHRGSFLFLLIQHQVGHWGFPKGHMEKGESTVQTAVRELKEETNLDLDHLFSRKSFIEKYSYHRDGKLHHKAVVYYAGLVSNGKVRVQKEEIQDFAWLSFEQTLEKLPFKEIKKILIAANKYVLKQKVAKR